MEAKLRLSFFVAVSPKKNQPAKTGDKESYSPDNSNPT